MVQSGSLAPCSGRLVAFASAEASLRSLARSVAHEYGPGGIHVAHIVIDGGINEVRLRTSAPQRAALDALERPEMTRAFIVDGRLDSSPIPNLALSISFRGPIPVIRSFRGRLGAPQNFFFRIKAPVCRSVRGRTHSGLRIGQYRFQDCIDGKPTVDHRPSEPESETMRPNSASRHIHSGYT